jgi:hypothetical protein
MGVQALLYSYLMGVQAVDQNISPADEDFRLRKYYFSFT